jgi:methionyl-tRNA synthetase
MQYGYQCEECEEAVWPATTRAELQWLKDRAHVVREVARHVQSGLDTWIVEGLEFLEKHDRHSVILARRGGS